MLAIDGFDLDPVCECEKQRSIVNVTRSGRVSQNMPRLHQDGETSTRAERCLENYNPKHFPGQTECFLEKSQR